MKALEDVAKKYCDEILPFAPVSTVCSFFVGVALFRAERATPDGSVWLHLLNENFQSYWYFLDILRETRIAIVVLIIALAFFGYLTFRECSKIFMSAGVKSQADELNKIYLGVLARAESSALTEQASSIAEKWYSRFEKKVLGTYKLGVFIGGLFAETVAVLFLHPNFVDAIFAVIFLLAAVCLSIGFGLIYYKAVLPRKMLLDASLGLIKPDSLSRIDGVE